MTVTIHLGWAFVFIVSIYALVYVVLFGSIMIGRWRGYNREEPITQTAKMCLLWPLMFILLPFIR